MDNQDNNSFNGNDFSSRQNSTPSQGTKAQTPNNPQNQGAQNPFAQHINSNYQKPQNPFSQHVSSNANLTRSQNPLNQNVSQNQKSRPQNNQYKPSSNQQQSNVNNQSNTNRNPFAKQPQNTNSQNQTNSNPFKSERSLFTQSSQPQRGLHNRSQGLQSARPQGQGLNINKVYPNNKVREQGLNQQNLNNKLNQNQSLRTKTPEEKLNRSMQNLAYTSGGIGYNGFNQNGNNANNSYQATQRKKVGGVVLDMDTIKDVNQKGVDTRTKRNNAIILILCLLLLLSCAYLAVVILRYVKSKRSPTCFYHINGDVEAEWFVEGSKSTKLIVPKELRADTKYLLESFIIINTEDAVTLNITISVTYQGEDIRVGGLTGCNSNLVRSATDRNVYEYNTDIVGGGKIYLFGGIDFEGSPVQINSDNIEINITANIFRVNQEVE